MFGIPNFQLFFLASLVLLLVPGPAVLYIVARSADQGRKAGLVSVAGIHLGTTVHLAAAVLGLSAVIAASTTAFTVVKLAGATYLLYLGIRTLRSAAPVVSDAHGSHRSMRRVFFDGAILNVLNPKTALFFLAFVPQFVDPAAGDATVQLIILGATFTALGMITDSLFALAAGFLGTWLRAHPIVAARQHWASGLSYIGLGLSAAIATSD